VQLRHRAGRQAQGEGALKMPTDPPRVKFRRRDPTRWTIAILAVIAVVLALVLIDRYLWSPCSGRLPICIAEAAFNGGACGKLSLDAIFSQDNGAVSSGPLTAAQNLAHPGTLPATISDDTGVMLLAKYTYNQVKLYASYEFIRFENPSNPQLTNFTEIAGYTVVAADINNKAYKR
jgi:hypothetical protein